MNYSHFWLSASLACNFTLVLLAVATCLFLIRRVDRLSRFEQMTEQRLIQLAFDLRRLEQRTYELEHRRGAGPIVGQSGSTGAPRSQKSGETETVPPLISVPDLTFQGEGEADDAASLAQKHGDVWAMAEAGLGPVEISQTTGRPIGQVELIVGLYRQYHASRSAGDHAKST